MIGAFVVLSSSQRCSKTPTKYLLSLRRPNHTCRVRVPTQWRACMPKESVLTHRGLTALRIVMCHVESKHIKGPKINVKTRCSRRMISVFPLQVSTRAFQGDPESTARHSLVIKCSRFQEATNAFFVECPTRFDEDLKYHCENWESNRSNKRSGTSIQKTMGLTHMKPSFRLNCSK